MLERRLEESTARSAGPSVHMTLGMVRQASLDPEAEGRLRTLRQLLDLRAELVLSQLPPGSAQLSSAGIGGRGACGMCGAPYGYKQGGGREKVAMLLQAIDLGHYTEAIVASGYVSSEDLSDADDDELSELVRRLCMKRPEERRLLKAVAATRAESAAMAAARPTTPRKDQAHAAAAAPATSDGIGSGGERVDRPEQPTGTLAPDEVNNAARSIQARHRGRVARRKVDQMQGEQGDAALLIQSVQRGRVARKLASKMQLRRGQGRPEPTDEPKH